MIILANLLAMLVIYKNKKLRNIPGVFRFNLAVADCSSSVIFVGSCVIPSYMIFSPYQFENINKTATNFSYDGVDFNDLFPATFKSPPFKGPTVNNAFGCFCYVAGFAVMYSYVLASFDRFFAIKYPIKYKIHATKRKAILACVVVWICALFFGLFIVFKENLYFWFFQSLFVFYKGEYEVVLDIILTLFPLCLCWVVNILMLLAIKKSKVNIKKVCNKSRSSVATAGLEKRVARAAKTIFVMVVVYTISILPYNINQVVHLSKTYTVIEGVKLAGKDEKGGKSVAGGVRNYQYVMCVIFLYNSFWNFFIYQVKDPDFRRYTKSFISRRGVPMKKLPKREIVEGGPRCVG